MKYLSAVGWILGPFVTLTAISQLAGTERGECLSAACFTEWQGKGRAETLSGKVTPDEIARIHGKIQFVTSFPDYKVEVVTAFEDLRVQLVESFPDQPGEWQIVDSFPDYKIQIVESFPDFKVRYVDSFPGKP